MPTRTYVGRAQRQQHFDEQGFLRSSSLIHADFFKLVFVKNMAKFIIVDKRFKELTSFMQFVFDLFRSFAFLGTSYFFRLLKMILMWFKKHTEKILQVYSDVYF